MSQRKVIVSHIVRNAPALPKKVDLCEATFHQWGSDYEEFESGPGNFTVAIVEYDNGAVGMVRADMVRFVDEAATEKTK